MPQNCLTQDIIEGQQAMAKKFGLRVDDFECDICLYLGGYWLKSKLMQPSVVDLCEDHAIELGLTW